MTTYRDMFVAELEAHGLTWCRGCAGTSSHRRGYAQGMTVHLDASIGTRASLMRGFHEIGHIVLGHTGSHRGLRRWEREAAAVGWAIGMMRSYRVPIPRKALAADRTYVARVKRWGDNVAAGRGR